MLSSTGIELAIITAFPVSNCTSRKVSTGAAAVNSGAQPEASTVPPAGVAGQTSRESGTRSASASGGAGGTAGTIR
jgi:hypothetical protein